MDHDDHDFITTYTRMAPGMVQTRVTLSSMVWTSSTEAQASSDDMYEKFKDYDFADAKPVSDFPHLRKLQAEGAEKTPVTLQVDKAVLAAFKARAAACGGDYEALMNEALRQYLQGEGLEEVMG